MSGCPACHFTGWVETTQVVRGVAFDAVRDCVCTDRPLWVKRPGPALAEGQEYQESDLDRYIRSEAPRDFLKEKEEAEIF